MQEIIVRRSIERAALIAAELDNGTTVDELLDALASAGLRLITDPERASLAYSQHLLATVRDAQRAA